MESILLLSKIGVRSTTTVNVASSASTACVRETGSSSVTCSTLTVAIRD